MINFFKFYWFWICSFFTKKSTECNVENEIKPTESEVEVKVEVVNQVEKKTWKAGSPFYYYLTRDTEECPVIVKATRKELLQSFSSSNIAKGRGVRFFTLNELSEAPLLTQERFINAALCKGKDIADFAELQVYLESL